MEIQLTASAIDLLLMSNCCYSNDLTQYVVLFASVRSGRWRMSRQVWCCAAWPWSTSPSPSVSCLSLSTSCWALCIWLWWTRAHSVRAGAPSPVPRRLILAPTVEMLKANLSSCHRLPGGAALQADGEEQ